MNDLTAAFALETLLSEATTSQRYALSLLADHRPQSRLNIWDSRSKREMSVYNIIPIAMQTV